MKTICVLMLALSGLMSSVARGDSPKSFTITVSESRIGAATLAAGEYKLLLHRDDNKVELKESKSGKLIEVNAKVVPGGAKSQSTEVHTQSVDGATRITEIRLGGTNLLVQFPTT